MDIHETILQARADGLEYRLEREAVRERAIPHIARRLLETHLGQQYYVHRIEITIDGQEFYLKGIEYRDGCKPELKAQVEYTLARIKEHLRSGGELNLKHWKPVYEV